MIPVREYTTVEEMKAHYRDVIGRVGRLAPKVVNPDFFASTRQRGSGVSRTRT